MTDTIYRGYDIRKGNKGFYVFKSEAQCHDEPFPTEDKAQDAIDQWKREQNKAAS